MPDTPDDRGGGSPRQGRAASVAFGAAIALLVAAGTLLRLWHLGEQPGGLFEDEAAEGLDAWRILHVPGFHPLFFAGDGGREPLFAYLVAGVFRVAGDSVLALRATAAVIGALGVLATPVALRRFGRSVQLGGTAVAATSLWLVAVDRDGFRNCLVPLAGTLALAALLAWSDRGRRRDAVLAGIACAAGLWTYQPLKLVPLWVGLWLLWVRRRDAAAWARLRPGLLAAVTAYAVVAAPMAFVAVTDPTSYFGRGLSVSAANPDQPLSQLPLHWLRTLGMFGVVGDPNPRHDAGGVPLVPPLIALLLAAGVWRAWRRRGESGHALLLLGLPVFVAPGLVALEGDAPHFLRALGLAPVVAGLAGLGVAEVVETGRRWYGARGTTMAAALVAVAVAATGAQTARAYFGRDVRERYHAYSFDVVALANAAGPGDAVIVDPYRALVVAFIDRDEPPTVVAPGAPPSACRCSVWLARDPGDLDRTFGTGTAARATVVARDPDGNPVVWRYVVGGR